MGPANEDEPCTRKSAIDLVSAVTELHALSSPDLSKLIRNAENGIIRWTKVDGSSFEINVESLARYLALHFFTKLLSVKGDQQHFRYLLGGVQLLHALCDLAYRYPILGQDLCEEGGALLLVHDIMKLPPCDDSHLMAGVSRLKSKVLSIMLHLCETEVERGCFLDLASRTTVGLDLAMSTVFQVLEVLKTMFCGDPKGPSACSFKGHPRGLLQLNAMRLTEIFFDDSNFRSYILLNFTEFLTTVFSLPHGEFLSSWCSSALEPSEEDVTMEYDSLSAAGQTLGVVSTSHVVRSAVSTRRAPQTPYARQKTTLFIKIVANLTCFDPDICKEEEGLFVNKFLQCLQKELPKLPDGERTAAACRNLHSLLLHAESLREYLNEDDVQLLSVQSEEKQQKRRKHNKMNDVQIALIETALRDEHDMQRKAESIQFWADKLSLHGSEVTSSQLKNLVEQS